MQPPKETKERLKKPKCIILTSPRNWRLVSPESHEEASVLVRKRKRQQRGAYSMAFIGVSVRKARQGRVDNLGLVNLSNFSRLQAVLAVLSCLAPGSEMTKAE